jgi:hypothetical protein
MSVMTPMKFSRAEISKIPVEFKLKMLDITGHQESIFSKMFFKTFTALVYL